MKHPPRTSEPAARRGWSEVWDIVRSIPPGRVLAYGDVAGLLSRPLTPRAVGWALHDCPDDVPWHRVVNVRGECSTDRIPGSKPGRQRRLLEREGVRFDVRGCVEMSTFRWRLP